MLMIDFSYLHWQNHQLNGSRLKLPVPKQWFRHQHSQTVTIVKSQTSLAALEIPSWKTAMLLTEMNIDFQTKVSGILMTWTLQDLIADICGVDFSKYSLRPLWFFKTLYENPFISMLIQVFLKPLAPTTKSSIELIPDYQSRGLFFLTSLFVQWWTLSIQRCPATTIFTTRG